MGEEIWILIPMAALAIPILAILTGPFKIRTAQAERKQARELYERIVMEKLDVIKTAVAMGNTKSEIDELDARLERLVGADRLASLLEEKAPKAPVADLKADLMDGDLEREIERLQRQREKQ